MPKNASASPLSCDTFHFRKMPARTPIYVDLLSLCRTLSLSIPFDSWIIPADSMRLPSITPKWSLLSLPQCTFNTPSNCFQLPAKISQFMLFSIRGYTDRRVPTRINWWMGPRFLTTSVRADNSRRGNLTVLRPGMFEIKPATSQSRFVVVQWRMSEMYRYASPARFSALAWSAGLAERKKNGAEGVRTAKGELCSSLGLPGGVSAPLT